jgi:phosphoribosylanthranilate isomerase
MREAANIAEIARLAPDFMGFIFYEPSPRYAGEMPPEALDALTPATKRVGVFVDAPKDRILAAARKYALDFVQLHGAESPALCAALRAAGLGVIKAFGIASRGDVARAAAYDGTCDYHVFDTAADAVHGGTGRKFNHRFLTAYSGRTPYLLSGGLGPEDAAALAAAALQHPRCIGVDINSRFETAPGVKNPEAIKQFIETIKCRQQ